jgi:hypothetical protein
MMSSNGLSQPSLFGIAQHCYLGPTIMPGGGSKIRSVLHFHKTYQDTSNHTSNLQATFVATC